jgi:hypothetical protein
MKVGITFSTFDLLNAGQVKMLEGKVTETFYNSRVHRFSSNGHRKQIQSVKR